MDNVHYTSTQVYNHVRAIALYRDARSPRPPTPSPTPPVANPSTRTALSRPRAVLRLRAPVRPRLGSSLRLSAAGAVRGCCGAVRARALLHVAPHRARVLEQREGHGHLGLGLGIGIGGVVQGKVVQI